MTYIQHKWSKMIHIVRDQLENGTFQTQCDRFYVASMAFTPELCGEREEKVVCYECRRVAAAQAGKLLYSRPTLRRGLTETKQRKLAPLFRAHAERQRLIAWNRAAQEK